MSAKLAKAALLSFSSPERKKTCESFFKLGAGEYGEGDVFIGVRTPDIRRVAKDFEDLSFQELKDLMTSKIHEERCLALLILIRQYDHNPHEIYEFYLQHTAYINNWDLVDISAHYIVGKHLLDKDRAILYDLVRSDNLWERRVAIVATWWFIRHNDFEDTLFLAKKLLQDKHDLMHKATGWMLREVGKKDVVVLRAFLDQHRLVMPRTALRYAIERFVPEERIQYMKKS